MDEKLKKTILKIVDEESGGVKSMHLLTNLILKGYDFEDVDKFYEILDSIPAEIPELGVLEYFADLGEIKRVKHFIYRK